MTRRRAFIALHNHRGARHHTWRAQIYRKEYQSESFILVVQRKDIHV